MEHNRIKLRPWKNEDVDALFFYLKEPEIALNAGWPVHQSVEDSTFLLKKVLQNWGFYAIVDKETDELIGSISILVGESSNFQIGADEGELCFWLGKAYWGKQLMAEAIELMLEYGFYDLNLNKIWCGCFADNSRCEHLQKKCSFKFAYEIPSVKTLIGEEKREIVMNMDFETYEKIYWE